MQSSQLLRDKARQCLDIADSVGDSEIVAALHKIARYFHDRATAAEASEHSEGAPDSPAPQRPRRAVRKPVRITATLRRQGESRFQAELSDLSETGFRVQSHYTMPVGAQVWLTLPGLAAIPAIVSWSSGDSLGCMFEAPLHPAVLERIVAGKKR